MKTSRREFLGAGLAAGALASLGPFGVGRPRTARAHTAPAEKPLRILVLGGTAFLGPAIVEHALERGHTLTLFNRGRTNTHLFPGVEKLVGDRDGDLAAIETGEWDAVVDTSGYVPRVVGDSAKLLADRVGQYLFISTISVYAGFGTPGQDEDAPLAQIDDPTVEEVDGETYGALKALCEQAARDAMPGRTTVVRPGLIVGPMDRTDRFTWWPHRVAQGGDVLAPGDPHQWLQFIDVRDLGQFVVHLLERGTTGTFNADRPPRSCTTGLLMHACKVASGSDARFHWASPDFLEEQGVAAWSEMPVWLPQQGDYAGFGLTSTARAQEAGLRCRSVEETCEATLAWWREQDAERTAKPRAGLAPAREAELLEAWATRGS